MNFQTCREDGLQNVLPLVMDLANPSPAIGWSHQERRSLVERGPVDVVIALALVHHLAISNNLPLDRIADFLLGLCRHLIIEFVPKEDPQAQRLLRSRTGIFADYSREAFEAVFSQRASIVDLRQLGHGKRVVYLIQARKLMFILPAP